MKDCKDIKDLLSPFLEGEVKAQEKAAVEAHLEGCSDCRSDLALLRQTVAALRNVPDLPPPAAILRGVRKEISPAPAKSFFRRFFGEGVWVGVPIGALAMAVLGIAAFVLQDRYPELQEGPAVTAPRKTVAPAVVEKTGEAVQEGPPVESPLVAEGKAETAAAPAGEDLSRQRAPEPPAERPSEIAETPPAAEGGADDRAKQEDTAASRPPAPPQPAPAPSAPPARLSPTAAVPPADASRGSEEAVAGMNDVRRLLESSELLSPGRRENGGPPLPAVDADPSAPAGRRGGETMVADPNGAEKNRSAGPWPTMDPELKKSVKRKTRAEAPPKKDLRAEDSLQAISGEMERKPGTGEFTEALTLLSLRGDDMSSLRRFIGAAGGQLLEIKPLDPSQSRKIARPFGDDIPPGQTIGRGWRIRALLPAGKVDGFIDAVTKEPQFRILNRTRTPAALRSAPGMQSLEIVVVR